MSLLINIIIMAKFRKNQAEEDQDHIEHTYFFDLFTGDQCESIMYFMGFVVLLSLIIRIILSICKLIPETLNDVKRKKDQKVTFYIAMKSFVLLIFRHPIFFYLVLAVANTLGLVFNDYFYAIN